MSTRRGRSFSRRDFLKTAGIITVGAAGCNGIGSSEIGADRNRHQKPNILLITSDQQRKDSLGVYSDGFAKTDKLDSLAADGVVFDRAYIPHATCTPSRASILTGQYASTHGAYTIGTALPYNSLKITDILVANGYETYAVGKMHFRPVSTPGEFESPPRILDQKFWEQFDGPYYGFQHNRLLNRHTSEAYSCRMHYGVWLKKQGLTEEDLSKYFNNQHIGQWKLPRNLHPSVFVAEQACEFIDEHEQKRPDKPFFMWASFQDPHSPHVVPAPYDKMYDPLKVEYKKYRPGEHDDKPPIYKELFEEGMGGLRFSDKFGVPCAQAAQAEKEDVWRRSAAIHHGMVKLMDEEIGKIIDSLKTRRLYDNTIIIFTSDHGDYLGNHGFTGKGFPAYDEVYNVPFIVKNVRQKNRAARSDALLGTIDIAPTILETIGIDVPPDMQGISQKYVFLGKIKHLRRGFMIENRAVQKGFYQKIYVTDRYKLVYYYRQTYGELYDLKHDPDQYHNLWDKTEYQSLKRDILFQLLCRNTTIHSNIPAGHSVSKLLRLLNQQIDAEGHVQPRTSFS